MAKFDKAYSKKLQKEITAYEYKKENMSLDNDLECCECKIFGEPIANLHLRKKESYFFATNPKSIHNYKCDYHTDFTDVKVIKLVKKNKNMTKEELDDKKKIITQTQNRLLKILINNTDDTIDTQKIRQISDTKTQFKEHSQNINTSKTKIQIAQRKIDKLSKDCDFLNTLVAVYGKVQVDIKPYPIGKYINQTAKLKIQGDKYTRLSIFILETTARQLNLKDGRYMCNFIGIGEVKLNEGIYLNFDFYQQPENLIFHNLVRRYNERSK